MNTTIPSTAIGESVGQTKFIKFGKKSRRRINLYSKPHLKKDVLCLHEICYMTSIPTTKPGYRISLSTQLIFFFWKWLIGWKKKSMQYILLDTFNSYFTLILLINTWCCIFWSFFLSYYLCFQITDSLCSLLFADTLNPLCKQLFIPVLIMLCFFLFRGIKAKRRCVHFFGFCFVLFHFILFQIFTFLLLGMQSVYIN